MTFLIDIRWERKTPHPDKPATGKSTYAARSRYLANAINKTKRKFRQQHGNNLRITSAKEYSDPAGILS